VDNKIDNKIIFNFKQQDQKIILFFNHIENFLKIQLHLKNPEANPYKITAIAENAIIDFTSYLRVYFSSYKFSGYDSFLKDLCTELYEYISTNFYNMNFSKEEAKTLLNFSLKEETHNLERIK
jgi:hypothetical protein